MQRGGKVGLGLGITAVAFVGFVAATNPSFVPKNGFVPSSGFVPWPKDAGAAVVIDSPASTTMSVAIVDSADPVITGGDAYAFTVTLTNTGTATATSVSVATTLDASLSYASSSGTGWSCSAASQVVTCTAASIAVGAAPAITINVTTGTSAVAASSSVVASASNASNATASQGTTVNLVAKDATAGVYLPEGSTQWSNFIARKGLSIAVPNMEHLLQEASGNPADSMAGAIALTASGTPAYQQSVAGWSRKGIAFTDGQVADLSTTSASLPSISTASFTTCLLVYVTSSTTTRTVIQHGTTTVDQFRVVIGAPRIQVASGVNTATGTADPTGAAHLDCLRTNRTATTTVGTTDTEKLTPTWGNPTNKKLGIGQSGNGPTMTVMWEVSWFNANAEISDANLRSMEQAMGLTASW